MTLPVMGYRGDLPDHRTMANRTALARNMLINTCRVLCKIVASNLWVRLLALRTHSNCQVYKYFWMTGRTKGVNLLIYIKGGYHPRRYNLQSSRHLHLQSLASYLSMPLLGPLAASISALWASWLYVLNHDKQLTFLQCLPCFLFKLG